MMTIQSQVGTVIFRSARRFYDEPTGSRNMRIGRRWSRVAARSALPCPAVSGKGTRGGHWRERMAADYDINLDDKYGPLAVIDLAAEAAEHEPWFNQTLTRVNDSVVRLGVIEGDFHWHKHDSEDEFFLVLEGELVIEVEGSDTVRLRPHQGYTVPKGVSHRTSAPERTVIVMVEPAGVVPTGD
jgi:mannose-6-phosphate isomerase-like protein (cupin superfamily)